MRVAEDPSRLVSWSMSKTPEPATLSSTGVFGGSTNVMPTWKVWDSVQHECPLGIEAGLKLPPKASTSATFEGGGVLGGSEVLDTRLKVYALASAKAMVLLMPS